MKKKKPMHYKLTVILLLLFISQYSIQGQSFSEKRTFRKTVAVRGDMTLEVSNKYGNIQITSWNIDSVAVRAEIEATASSQGKTGKMLEGITINISETDYLIRARTEFTQSINMFFESFKGMTSKLIPYESKVQINYFISMPESVNLKIINKYGDVYMESNTGNVSAAVSNGSFKANSLKSARELDLSFCDATINSVSDAVIDASFSEINIANSGDLRINSVSSKFELKKSSGIDAESRRDKFYIGTTGSLKGSSYFTDFRIDMLTEVMDLTTRYGSISADKIDKTLKNISINSGYSDIMLTFDPDLSFSLHIRHINASLSLPEKDARLEKKSISEDKNENITFGTIGRNPGNAKVKIDATHGRVSLK